ncbi:MAG TPA: PTS system mannose/fructose/sorbose family transporter subunit IID, partial [bacterium]|nr:PTS system mannose/fructose/sorbose family transporter subunit IID [bacterium]
GPLAAAGGAFFWEGLRPLWGLIGVAWVLLAPEALAAWGVLLAVLGYNLTHLHMRWYGLGAGWRDGEQAIREYLRHFRGRLGTVHRVGLLLLGGLMVYLPDALLTGGMRPSQPVAITLDYLGWLLGAWLLFGVFLYALRQQLGVTRILFICAAMAQLAAWGGALWR